MKVKCLECGKEFGNLTTHLIKTEKLTREQYLKKHPNAQMVSEEFREKQRQAAKLRIQADPEAYSLVVSSRKYDFISNEALQPLLQRDDKNAKLCLERQLWKPAIILYSSVVEAILREKTKKPDFSSALREAYKKNYISEIEYHQIHVVKELRNFVHLHKELSADVEPNEYWARAIADMCESIIKRFKSSSYKS